MVFYYKVPTMISLLQNCVSNNEIIFPKLPSFGNPKSHHHDSKPTRIQNSNLQCSISPYPKCHVHPKQCNQPTPLTLPPLYSRFHPQNPYEMTKNEMKPFCNLLSIYLLHYNLYSINLHKK